MDKKQLVVQVISQLQADLDTNIAAANKAREDATHEENVAENKYDTLGLEASYLAHGQSRRVEALEIEIAAYRSMLLRDFTEDSVVGLSALVTLEAEDGTLKYLFIGPAGGGIQIKYKSYTVIFITPEAPIGKVLMGRYSGDVVMLPQGEFEITDLC
ncbi:GreA/GreB family elongation factor [Amphritea japonica]|uniref:Elongation factor GreAB n=1 Tax=Amphritea japonica ATCC BAA-1530 TaxID=1278309 RepID=A0A7R6P1W9_9GAMM|nr:hypothetical protein [Amphritea japonica]BBB25653.1 elongation factor GreAB [Amphritea japonica ATCC BAA-1530]